MDSGVLEEPRLGCCIDQVWHALSTSHASFFSGIYCQSEIRKLRPRSRKQMCRVFLKEIL